MFGKLFGKKKNGGFYLELDENEVVQDVAETATKVKETAQEKVAEIKESKVVKNAVATASDVVETAQEKVAEIKESKVVKNAVESTSEAAETARQKVSAVATTEEKATTNGKSKAKKSQKAEPKSEKQAPAAAKPANSGASSFDPPFWVKAMYNNNGSNGSSQQSEQTFATDYLMPTVTKYRRRPGPSLDKFKDMAKKSRGSRI